LSQFFPGFSRTILNRAGTIGEFSSPSWSDESETLIIRGLRKRRFPRKSSNHPDKKAYHLPVHSFREIFLRDSSLRGLPENIPLRGRRPAIAIGKAIKFAERQGYRWVPNPDKDIPFDAFV